MSDTGPSLSRTLGGGGCAPRGREPSTLRFGGSDVMIRILRYEPKGRSHAKQ